MQRALLILLPIFLLAAVGAGTWLLLVKEPGAGDAAGVAPAASSDARRAVLLDAPEEPAPPPAAAGDQPEPAAPAPAPARPDDERRTATGTRAIPGRVALPLGTPADERMEVVALERPLRPIGRAIDARPGLSDISGVRVLARAEVAPEGTFVLELPAEPRDPFVVLRARYLFVDDGLRVDPDEEQPRLDFEPRLGAWITGRLVLPAGAGAAELDPRRPTVTLAIDPAQRLSGSRSRREGRTARRADTQEDLTFEILGVPPEEGYVLRVVPDNFAAARTGAVEARPGEHAHVDIRLFRGATVAGRVVSRGRPVEHAELTAVQDPVMFGQGGFEVRKRRSGPDGRFTLPAVAPGKVLLKASKEGFLGHAQALELDEGQLLELEIELDAGNTIAGIVRWPDGAPAANVLVEVEFDISQMGGMGAFNALQGADGHARTDADGRFAVTGLGNGPFTVTADAEPPGSEEGTVARRDRWRARAQTVKRGTEDLELVLEAPRGLPGYVVDDTGELVTKFQVRARTRTAGMLAGLGGESVDERFEDQQGRFLLPGIRSGEWDVQAVAEGYGRGRIATVAVPAQGDVPPVELVVERAASVAGVVLDTDGQPVGGAEVGLRLTLQDLARIGAAGGDEPRATSGERGAFVLEGVSPGAVSLVARREGFADSEPVGVDVAPAQRVEDVVLRLRTGGRILGEIFGSDGDPLRGATILAQMPAELGAQRFTTSDGSGRFVYEHVPPGAWQVMTMPRDPGSTTGGDDVAKLFAELKFATAEVVDGEDVHVQLGAPPKAPVRLFGRVRLGGEPVAEAMVSFVPDGRPGASAMRFAGTTEDGSYELTLDEPGAHLVTLQKIGGSGMQQQNFTFLEEIPEKDEHRLDVDLPLGKISGRVRGQGGEKLAGARVSLTVDGALQSGSMFGEHYHEVVTDERGEYELVWLKRGKYTVGAGGAAFGGLFGSEASHGRQVRAGLELEEGQWLRGVDFRLQAPGRVEGTVTNPSGQPVARAGIFLRDDEGRLVERISLIETDASGRFEYKGLQPGRYEIFARGAKLVSAEAASVRVEEGAAASVRLVLHPGTILIVTLSDEEGNPVQANLLVTDEAGRQVNGLATFSELMTLVGQGGFSSREQRTGPLAPGTYSVTATASDGRSAAKPVRLSGQLERRLNLRLRN